MLVSYPLTGPIVVMNTVSESGESPAGTGGDTPTTNWIARHRIAAFFLFAYAIAWGLEGVILLLGLEPSWTWWFIGGFLGPLAPAISAVVVLRASGESVRGWLRDVLRWRVHPAWYVVAIAVPFLIAYASGVVGWLLGDPIDWTAFAFDPVSIGIGIVLGTLIGGGQEELGWRGFAQPELQARYGAFGAAVIVGVFWGLWHLPQFVLPGGIRADWPAVLILSYFTGIVAFSVLLAWVFNGSGGSALLAMLMHGADNSTTGRVPLDLDVVLIGDTVNWSLLSGTYVSHALLTWLVVLLVIGVSGAGLYARRVRRRGRTARGSPEGVTGED
ncbi:type II CAAX endopeptidase family protein [Salinirubrum litoreum]|nr:type II CAAX endopeptidase family protein [Salinirubrum litoreum]